MKNYTFLAFDIGATSGRAILGRLEGVKFDIQEIHRFPNAIVELHGRYYWDLYQLYQAMRESLLLCGQRGLSIDSIGIDTWGVDYGFVAADGTLLGLPRSYRDPYTEGAPEQLYRKISREELYRKSGIQIMNFNSIFQLFRARSEAFAPLLYAEKMLFMPDLLSYLLTGKQVCEQTIASTSQLINPTTRQWDPELLRAAGISSTLLPPLVAPGTFIGELGDALASETGLGKVPVVAVAGHDTAAAVAAVPATDRHFAYLSSGTWSLMGIEAEQPIINDASYNYNFTNEGGIEGTVRFLKNITGMWLLERCRADWEKEGRQYNYPEIVRMAEEAASFTTTIPPDDPDFANPRSMTEAIIDKCKKQGDAAPESDAEFVRCIFNSLAIRYKEVLELLREMAPFPIERLHVIGGGSQNTLLNQYTADCCGIPVVAGPAEATAIGNCLIQAIAQGAVADRWAMRQLIADSFPTETFYPRHTN